jgi:hypothetical protein
MKLQKQLYTRKAMNPMAAKRTSVYLTENTLRILGQADDSPELESLSGRINAAIGRFGELVADGMPALTKGEWCAIMDANNGCFTHEFQPDERSLLWANLADSQGMDEKWGIDSNALVKKMRIWSQVESTAAIEAVAAFWRNYELPTDEALIRAGVRIL